MASKYCKRPLFLILWHLAQHEFHYFTLTETNLLSDVTCVGHWPKIAFEEDRTAAPSKSPNSDTEQNVRNVTESNKFSSIPRIPATLTNLIVQDRSGVARCLQFSRVPGEERLKLSVKMFESECVEQNLMSQAVLTYQGACQEALTDVSSISGAIRSKNSLNLFPILMLLLFVLNHKL